jgi:mono/diheme cytochrome c family protein
MLKASRPHVNGPLEPMNGSESIKAFAKLPLTILLLLAVSLSGCSRSPGSASASAGALVDLCPTVLVASPDCQTLYIACAAANQVLVFDTSQRLIIRRFSTPAGPSGLALSADGKRLFVTCAAPRSRICLFDTASCKLQQTLFAGHTALSPVLSRDHKTLFVCNRFNDAISIFDLSLGREVARVQVAREPVSAAVTPDGRFLLVANHLPRGRSDVGYVAATVSVIDLAKRQVTKELRLPNGSINLRDLRVSPNGKHACVVHTVGHFQLPVTQLQGGWVNTSALTMIDLANLAALKTVALDDVDRGAANPWALAWSADSRWLAVTHAGTHELSLIDFPALLNKLAAASGDTGNPLNNLSFLSTMRRRVQLSGNGPRALAIADGYAFVAGYFSDSLDAIALSAAKPSAESVALHPGHKTTPIRLGEMYFNDASLCFQGWQSCASCHDDDGRVDGLNWDLLNDGIGNPKDTKSLLLSHQTPPVMSLGVRATAEIAVRNGIQNSLASSLPEEIAAAIDQWLKSLKPAPSPHLIDGHFSPAAQRGEKIFKSSGTGCATCHEPDLFTDLRPYAVGTENTFDKQALDFDTPTLHELWRTAPYLHDGSAATLRDVLTTRNPRNEHGHTSQLSAQQLDDLLEYLLSL